MPNLTLNVPQELFDELTNISKRLKESPENCMLLALGHALQTDTLDNAMTGVDRIEDGQDLIDFPELKEELDMDIQFHPEAMDELEVLDEDDQIEVLGQLIERITAEEEELADTLDLVIKDYPDTQIVISSFEFGDIVYQNGEKIIIYHLALDQDQDFGDDEDEDEDEDDDAEFLDDEGEDLFDEAEEEIEHNHKN